MTIIKVCVFGGRDFGYNKFAKTYYPDVVNRAFAVIDRCLEVYINDPDVKIVFVVGKATGADTVGEMYADDRGYAKDEYPPQWRVNGVYNPRAGFERNSQMVATGTHFIGFWDGISGGTKDTIKKVKERERPLRVFNYNFELMQP